MFSKTFLKDAAERVVASFVGGFAAAYNPIVDLPMGTVFKVAAGAGIFSAIKALVAHFKGDPATASLVQ